MGVCHCCLKETDQDFCRACSKALFGVTRFHATLDYSAPQLAIAAEGTVEKMEEVKAGLLDGSIKVFDTATEGFITKDGAALTSYMADVDTDDAFTPDTEVVADGYFHESEFRSAPYFDVQIDGIELLNSAF